VHPNKAALKRYCDAYGYPSADGYADAVNTFYAENADINVVHPFNKVAGAGAYIHRVLGSLQDAFENLCRTDYIAFGGDYENAEWVTNTGYYTGTFKKPWLGIQPTNTLAHLRFGEFHRMENGQAVESYIFFDLPELMIAAGQWPVKSSPGIKRGYTGYLAGPAKHDGHQWHENDPTRSQSSYEMVTKMLQSLATKDEAWRPYWHDNMFWYGPAAFGSFIGIEDFAGFQVPFEGAFSEWIGGTIPGSKTRHFTRFGDGDYVCSGGWPSLNMIQIKPFLDQAPTDERLYMRVCDWWRRDKTPQGDLLVENWVFVDIPDVLKQLGNDLFADIETP
jgi:hypothetical protein